MQPICVSDATLTPIIGRSLLSVPIDPIGPIARPPAVVQWYRNNVMIDGTSTIIQEGSRVRNELVIPKVNRNDLFAEFRCQAFNTNHSLPIETKVVLDINCKSNTCLASKFCLSFCDCLSYV